MEEAKEPIQTSSTTTQSTTTPGVASTSEKILIMLLGIVALSMAAIVLLSILSGKTEAGMERIATVAGLALGGALALMKVKSS